MSFFLRVREEVDYLVWRGQQWEEKEGGREKNGKRQTGEQEEEEGREMTSGDLREGWLQGSTCSATSPTGTGGVAVDRSNEGTMTPAVESGRLTLAWPWGKGV